MVSLAVEAARLSPCRSKRGVVIFDDLWISSGFNHQPLPFTCDGSPECKANCGKTAIHAEQAAILRAAGDFVGLGANKRLVGAQILHIKVVDGQPVPSAGPSCMECSKLILQAGMVGMWLLLLK